MRPSKGNSAAPKRSIAAPEHVDWNWKLTLDIPEFWSEEQKKKVLGKIYGKFESNIGILRFEMKSKNWN